MKPSSQDAAARDSGVRRQVGVSQAKSVPRHFPWTKPKWHEPSDLRPARLRSPGTATSNPADQDVERSVFSP